LNQKIKILNRLETRQGPTLVGKGDFLTLHKRQVRNIYESGETSVWYDVETAAPPFLDAVVLILYSASGAKDLPRVLLRRAARPAAFFRSLEPKLRDLDGQNLNGVMWELPAGGVEPSDLEDDGAGVPGRAVLEAWEEGGFKVKDEDLISLGAPPFSAPALCTERLHYFAVKVDPKTARPPEGDGHPMEEGADLCFLSIDQALAWCRQGRIIDLKSEVGLNRFKDWWESISKLAMI
jgi:ADP-ribose pyrophosphatase